MSNISFDYDDTLDLGQGLPDEAMVSRFKAHMSAGDKVYVVTSRMWTSDGEDQIDEFLDEHGLIAEDVVFTNMCLKVDTLYRLGCSIHYDDNPEELIVLEDYGITGIDAIYGKPFDKRTRWR